MNGVIDKVLLLQDGSITARTKNFLQEYKNEITYPHIENPKTHCNIAYPDIDDIETLWERYRFLLHCIAYSTVSNKGCISIENGSHIDYKSTYQERVNNLNCLPDPLREFFKNKQGSLLETTNISNFCNTLSAKGIQCLPINSDSLTEKEVLALLADYADENLEIIATIIGSVKFSSSQYTEEAEEIFNILKSGARDNTKYFVSYNGVSLTPTPIAKSEVAFLIFKEWAKAYKANLSSIRTAFPKDVNPYYSSGKYFKELFYPYSSKGYYFDGTDPKFNSSVPDNSNWNFYRDNIHLYYNITNLKMWRKDAFDSLIDYIKKTHSSFAKDLSIVDSLGNTIL